MQFVRNTLKSLAVPRCDSSSQTLKFILYCDKSQMCNNVQFLNDANWPNQHT